jgi:hypothetical protein
MILNSVRVAAHVFKRRYPRYEEELLPHGAVPSRALALDYQGLAVLRHSASVPFGLGTPCRPEATARELFAGHFFWTQSVQVRELWHFNPGPHRDRTKLVLQFDLTLPMEPQFRHAEEIFKRCLQQGLQAGELRPAPTAPRIYASKWTAYLRALDGWAAGASQKQIGIALFSNTPEPRDRARYAIKKGLELAEKGYRGLLLHYDARGEGNQEES